MAGKKLDRPGPGQGRMLAGVAGGLAQYYGWSTTMVRLVFVLTGLFGAGELAYIILWLVMPRR